MFSVHLDMELALGEGGGRLSLSSDMLYLIVDAKWDPQDYPALNPTINLCLTPTLTIFDLIFNRVTVAS